MRTGIIAKKIGITSLFHEDGSRTPATILSVNDCEVTNIRTIDKNKYTAVQVGLINQKINKIKKPQKESYAKNKSTPKKILKNLEFQIKIY